MNYNGPTNVSIYWDTLFGSFLFVPTTVSPNLDIIQQGSVKNAQGQPARHEAVRLLVNGVTYHTYTNNNGSYTFYGPPTLRTTVHPLTGQLSVGQIFQTVTLGPAIPEIRLP